MAEVLLIEDDASIRGSLGRALAGLGHGITFAETAMAGLEQAVALRPDVIVLDLGLPDLDGTALLRMLRSVSDVPVIVATARDDEGEVVHTLRAGADDYVVKPFTAEQLDARILAVLRRAREPERDAPILVGELRVDPVAREASLAGRDLNLTRLEFDLLHHLARRAGQVVSRRDLMAQVWRQPHGGADKTLEVHLSWLRRKLGESGTAPRYLHTVRGVGVKLAAPEGEAPGREPGDRGEP